MSNVFSLNGSDWFIYPDGASSGVLDKLYSAPTSGEGWVPARVPGNIQADLEAAHILKPLWYGAGDCRMEEVPRKDWWYRKDFFAPNSFREKRVKLVFDGVDYECEVWLNNKRLGTHADMFRRFGFDVADIIRLGKTNQLVVKIYRRNPERDKIDPEFWNHNLPGKSPINQGWDWGIRLWTLGIWKDVRLEASGPARIDWVQVQTRLRDEYRKATVKARLEIDSLDYRRAKAVFRIRGWGTKSEVVVDTVLGKGNSIVEVELELDNPNLWWPNGQGEQALYKLDSQLITKRDELLQFKCSNCSENIAVTYVGVGEVAECEKCKARVRIPEDAVQLLDAEGVNATDNVRETVSHANTTRFGVREIRWEQVEGASADFINPFQLIVNGQPIRMMGANILPPDCLLARSDERGIRLLHLAKGAGMNALRVWGGGISFSQRMYDLADELGLMMSQEFPLGGGVPPSDSVYVETLEATILSIVKQLRNHPCVIEWGGGNEVQWKQGGNQPALLAMERIVANHDDRIFRATCPIQGSYGHSPYMYWPEWKPYVKFFGTSEENDYYQFYNSRDQMRVGEFGAQSPAHLEVWHREIPPSSQWPFGNFHDSVLIRKNVFSPTDNIWYWLNAWLFKETAERLFGPFDGLESLVEAGQFMGAEGIRYPVDEFRRKGKRIGGFFSWILNEPWPNGAGPYLIDYDGRPLMNYDFAKQALSPISLSLRYDSIFYDLLEDVNAEAWLVSDAPQLASGLKWQWVARDRRGHVVGRGGGTASIGPGEVKKLEAIRVKLPQQTAFGPVFIELQLSDAVGTLLTERIHVFGMAGVNGPLGGLLRNKEPDKSDDTPGALPQFEGPDSPNNLAYVGNGACPAVASSELEVQTIDETDYIHTAIGLNDGQYGNQGSWIATEPKSFFTIDLGKFATIGRFKLGRDRNGVFHANRALGYLKIETSENGETWQAVFEKKGIADLAGYTPVRTMEIHIKPVRAGFVRVTVDPKEGQSEFAAIDEFEVYPPKAKVKGVLPQINFTDHNLFYRPVQRTILLASAQTVRIEGDNEILAIEITNTGKMTALFCEPHPLLEYRTDIDVLNNHTSVPPGEKRTVTILAPKTPKGGLSLAQTGWRFSCWNADEVTIQPIDEVLLSVGRRDAMCREFLGYKDLCQIAVGPVQLTGNRPDPSKLPLLQKSNGSVSQFVFQVAVEQTSGPARLRIHTADQSCDLTALIEVKVNSRRFLQCLPKGLGMQNSDPAHLAFPASVEFQIPKGILKTGRNRLEVRVKDGGWFSWDAMDMVTQGNSA